MAFDWYPFPVQDSTQSGKLIGGLSPTWRVISAVTQCFNLETSAPISPLPTIVTTPVVGIYKVGWDLTTGGQVTGTIDAGSSLTLDGDRYIPFSITYANYLQPADIVAIQGGGGSGSLPLPIIPGQAQFNAWVYATLQIPTSALPTDSPYLVWAYSVAVEIVNEQLLCVSPTIYTLAVYNLGADNLINFAQDQPGQTYFQILRGPPSAPENQYGLAGGYGINAFVPGVTQSTNDVTTGTSLVVPEFMKELTMANLANLKTPWGRQYLALAQRTSTIWGIS